MKSHFRHTHTPLPSNSGCPFRMIPINVEIHYSLRSKIHVSISTSHYLTTVFTLHVRHSKGISNSFFSVVRVIYYVQYIININNLIRTFLSALHPTITCQSVLNFVNKIYKLHIKMSIIVTFKCVCFRFFKNYIDRRRQSSKKEKEIVNLRYIQVHIDYIR